jgi:hypothetical protein
MTFPVPRVRHTAPAHEVEYFLDCAQEAVEMDACTAMTLRLYGDDASLLPLATQRFCSFRKRLDHCMSMAEIADGILARLPPARRAGLVHLGLRGVSYETVQMAEVFSNWAIDDATEGGDLEPFRDRPRCRGGTIFKRTARRLHSPKFVRRYVKHHAREADHLQALADLVIRRARELPGPAALDRSLTEDWRAQLNHRKTVEQRVSRRDARKARKVVLRSLRSALGICGPETVTAFLRGEEVKLVGAESILVLRKRGLLTDRGHGCVSVGLLDRNGIRLADLCTFVEGTPTLDQLSAFALWMGSGEDRAVLETANVITLSPAGEGHPLLARKAETRLRIRDEALAELVRLVGPDRAADLIGEPIAGRRPFIRQITYEERRARNDAYWEETKGHWIEAMMVMIVGYRNFPILKAAGAL